MNEKKICPCGCGTEFTPTRAWQKFRSTACRNNYYNRINKEKKAKPQPFAKQWSDSIQPVAEAHRVPTQMTPINTTNADNKDK